MPLGRQQVFLEMLSLIWFDECSIFSQTQPWLQLGQVWYLDPSTHSYGCKGGPLVQLLPLRKRLEADSLSVCGSMRMETVKLLTLKCDCKGDMKKILGVMEMFYNLIMWFLISHTPVCWKGKF